MSAPFDDSPDEDSPAVEVPDVDVAEDPPAGGSAIRTTAIIIGVIAAGLVALLAFGGGATAPQPNGTLGKRVPLVQGMPLEGLAGSSVNDAGEPIAYSIDAEAGSWVLVNFFATWCAGCIVEHPELVALEGWGRNNNLGIVAVVFDDPNTVAIGQFFDDRGGDWPVLVSPRSAIDFEISLIPESFLVAPSGLVVEHYVGGLTAESVQQTIEDLSS